MRCFSILQKLRTQVSPGLQLLEGIIRTREHQTSGQRWDASSPRYPLLGD